MSDDPAFIEHAGLVLRGLPQPDLIILRDTPLDVIQGQKLDPKPSERGAFNSGVPISDDKATAFADYQQRTGTALSQVLIRHHAELHVVSHTAEPADVLDLIAGRLA